MAIFNPYYNQNRYQSYEGYTPYSSGSSQQVPGMSFNSSTNAHRAQMNAGAGVGGGMGYGGYNGGSNGSNIGGKIGSGVAIAGAGLNAYEGSKASVNGFDIDNLAGLKGAGEGAAAGSAAGPWGTLVGAIVGTVAGSIGTVQGVNDNIKKLDTNVNATGYDQFGNPMYKGQEYLNAKTNSEALTHGIHENYQTSDITGTRWIGEAIFNTRKKARRKRAELNRNRVIAQTNYNNAATSANSNYIANQDYQNSLNNSNRLYNLYN